MNLRTDQDRRRKATGETSRLWEDSRIWWVNCVAVEAGWTERIAREHLPAARRDRDAILAEFLGSW